MSAASEETGPYLTLAEYPLEEVLPHICPKRKLVKLPDGREVMRTQKRKREFEADDGTVFKVKVSSLRLQTFKDKGTVCVGCGAVGKVFRLQTFRKAKPESQGTPHLNLWGENRHGNMVLFTKDHITALRTEART